MQEEIKKKISLNQVVKRNVERFPDDFAYQLTKQEFTALISQSVISKQVITQILENSDKESVLEQLKEEIKKKISLNPYAGDG